MSSNLLNSIALILFIGSIIFGLVLATNASSGGFVLFCYSAGAGLFVTALLAGIARIIELLEQLTIEASVANEPIYAENRKSNHPEKGKAKKSYLDNEV